MGISAWLVPLVVQPPCLTISKMVQLVVFPLIASVILSIQIAAQGGVESQAIPGYLPGDYVRALKIDDGRPNDVYGHLALRRPVLTSEEIVIYPHHFGFEYGQDPENSIYEITNAKELVAKHGKKHHKHAHKHDKHHEHHAHPEHDQHEHDHHEPQAQATNTNSIVQEPHAYEHTEPTRQFRPRPAYSVPQTNDDQVHPHFG